MLFLIWAPKLSTYLYRVILENFATANHGFMVLHIVKIKPTGNVLPKATKVMICAIKNDFKLDNAKPSYQERKRGKIVLWDDNFVDQMKRGLLATRVM